MAMASLIIVPTIEELSTSRRNSVACPAQGCDRVFSQGAALRLHLVKVHGIVESDRDLALINGTAKLHKFVENKRYHCPVEGCKYNRQLGRYFTSMPLLKQHYIHVHAEKKYKCGRCGSGYAQERDLARHEKNCQLMFVCAKCKKIYNSREALVTHCRRENHKSNFEGVNREAFARQEYIPAAPQEANKPAPPRVTKSGSSDKKPVKVSFISPAQARRILTIFHPGNNTKPLPTSQSLQVPSSALIKNTSEIYPLTGGMVTLRNPKSLLHLPNTSDISSSSSTLPSGSVKSNALNQNIGSLNISLNATASPPKSTGSGTEINHQAQSGAVSSAEVNPADGERSPPMAVTGEGAPSNQLNDKEHQSVLTISTIDLVKNSGLARAPAPTTSTEVISSSPASSDIIITRPGSSPSHLSCSGSDPKSMVLGLLDSDLFINWSRCVKSGFNPSKAFKTVSDWSNNSRNQTSSDAQKFNTQLNNIPVKMMSDIQNLQMKTDFLSLIQDCDFGDNQEAVKIHVSELLGDMKNELQKLQDSCKELLSKSKPTYLTPNQGSSTVEKFIHSSHPANSVKSKSKLLLPKPNILMLPVNFQSNVSVSGVSQDPLVFICDPSSVPLQRRAPKPIKPKPIPVTVTSATTLSTTATMTECPDGRYSGQDMEMQTDCASFTSRGVGTNISATPTCDFSSLSEGVHIGIQTSQQNAASSTQTSLSTNMNALIPDKSAKSPETCSRKRSSSKKYSLEVSDEKASKPKRRKNKTESESKGISKGKSGIKQRKKRKGKVSAACVPILHDTDEIISINQTKKSVRVPRSNPGLLSHQDAITIQSRGSNHINSCGNVESLYPNMRVDKDIGRVPGRGTSTTIPGSLSIAIGTRDIDFVSEQRQCMSVGTMPSPSFISDPALGMNSVSFNSQGTDPLPGFSGATMDDPDTLSLFSSQQTQTSLWKEIEDTIMAENNSTQTMESFLVDASLQVGGDGESSLSLPTLMESGVQASSAQHSQTQTLCDDLPLSHSKSVGVGTSLLDDTSPLLDGMGPEAFSRSVGIDTQLFDDLFPEVSSRSVAISTPLLDGSATNNTEGTSVGTSTFQPIEHSSVSVGVSPTRTVFPVSPLSNTNQTNLAENNYNPSNSNVLRYESIATASVQTDTDLALRSFLTSGSQTSDFDTSYINMETQTVNDMYNQLLSNMETQTTDAFLAGLGFADIETQTVGIDQRSASVETQTSSTSGAVTHSVPVSSTAATTASTIQDFNLRSEPSRREGSVSIDTETQTLLPNLHLTEGCLTDSHTQTTLTEFETLVEQLEKN